MCNSDGTFCCRMRSAVKGQPEGKKGDGIAFTDSIGEELFNKEEEK